jgi:hypothetical protein
VDDPGDAGGFNRAEISDVVLMRKVDNERVDRYGWRLAAAFHAMRVQQTFARYWSRTGFASTD